MTIHKRTFGRTGHQSSAVLFGAAALAKVDQATADRVLDLLFAHGVNHIDVAAGYGDAELRVGPWMDRYRKEFFLATKTGKRDRAGAYAEIRRSLDRLRTDQVDLIQLHALTHPDEWEQAMSPGGALEAAIQAREEGLVRFIGVTGHGWNVAAMHKRSLERFDFDSVLLPYNYVMMQNPQYAADFESLAAMCQKRNVAVQTIKGVCRRPWGDQPHSRATWYEPLEDQAAVDKTVAWILSRPGIFLNTVGDIHVLPHVLEAGNRFQAAPSDKEMKALLEEQAMAPLFV
jgi:aryl-alcohol dehydrogenase-like predicted oxidoreductase